MPFAQWPGACAGSTSPRRSKCKESANPLCIRLASDVSPGDVLQFYGGLFDYLLELVNVFVRSHFVAAKRQGGLIA